MSNLYNISKQITKKTDKINKKWKVRWNHWSKIQRDKLKIGNGSSLFQIV